MRFGGAVGNNGVGSEEVSPDVAKFWELFAWNRHAEAQELGRRMATTIRDVTEATYSFDGDEGTADEGEKKPPSTPTVKPSTPAATISAWNYKFETSVISLNKKHGYCLARIGKDKVQDDFRACIKLNCISTGHVGMGVYRMDLPLKDFKWAIKVGISDKALGTSPQVFSNPTLLHKDFPESFSQPGGRMFALENYLLRAKVWKVLFEGFPGQDVLLGYSLEGEDAPRVSGGGTKLPPTPALSSFPPQARDEELEEVMDDDPPGPMDTSLLEDEFATPFSQASRPATDNPEPHPHEGLGDGASDLSINTEDSNAGIRVEGTTPRFGWEAYANQGSRVPMEGSGSIAVSDATSLGTGELSATIQKLKNEVKYLKSAELHRDSALGAVFRSLRVQLDQQALTIARQETAIRGLSRPGGVTIPPPTPNQAMQAPDLGQWGNREWDIVTRAVAARQDTSMYLKPQDLRGYITRRECDELVEGNSRWGALSPQEVQQQLSAHGRELFEEGGAVLSLIQRLERLEASRGSQAVEVGGMTFADEAAVKVFFNTLGDPEAYRFCLDFVSVLTLAQDAFDTESEGLATKAAAHKAEYKSVNAARVATSYELTFPSHIIVKSDSTGAHEDLGGYKWAPGFVTRRAYEGSFHNGTKEQMKRRVQQVERTWTNSINAQYSPKHQPRINNVFLSQLRGACAQALHFLESLTAIPDLLQDSGMKAEQAWKRSAVFPKALFEDIAQTRRTVSEATDGGAMMFGAFRTSVMVQEYSSHNFAEHPKIGLMLCLTSFNREGQATEAAVAALGVEAGKIKGHDTRIVSLESKFKKLMTNNPNLN